MRLKVLVTFLLFCSLINGQTNNTIFKDLGLVDSLTHEYQIRIYKGPGITNYSTVFEMYFESGKWNAVFYEHYNGIEPTIIKTILTSNSKPDYIFQNFLRSYALELPDLKDIRWKMHTKREIYKEEGSFRGKPFKKYWDMKTEHHILDGNIFYFQIKNDKTIHSFNYSNPDSYLITYPNIDELIFVNEILDTVRSEFNIWKKEE